ncbi:unnamed protein product [Paramecium sonneborni]|uniref:Uncharacterized protein n=1 Tax=Paramecium sonneborni TaxID=65129 RepID=A0A8S1NS72_9CILI|nr:unnamed protein product [Paramecium sonneborni]
MIITTIMGNQNKFYLTQFLESLKQQSEQQQYLLNRFQNKYTIIISLEKVKEKSFSLSTIFIGQGIISLKYLVFSDN